MREAPTRPGEGCFSDCRLWSCADRSMFRNGTMYIRYRTRRAPPRGALRDTAIT
jgi:hypothetical protein